VIPQHTEMGGRKPALERRPLAAKLVLVRFRCAQGAAEAGKKGLKMTAAFGLRTGALALCLVMVVHARPAPDTNRRTDSVTAWNDRCSLSIHGATVHWVVGDSGNVIKAVDGDTTVRCVIGEGQYDLCGVSFADAKHGWIVGSKRDDPERGRGVIFRTAAGGHGSQAWTASCPVIRPDVNVPFLKVEALDFRHIWLNCGDGYTFYSNDGGTRWTVTAKRSGSDESYTVGSNHAK
jgi:hypothetical protein